MTKPAPGKDWRDWRLWLQLACVASSAVNLPHRPRFQAAVAGVAVVLSLGGVPGERLRLVADWTAPPVPLDVKDRGASVEVVVRSAVGGPPVSGVHVRALAIIDERAYLADACDTDQNGQAHLGHLPLGEFWMIADAPGRARASSHLVVGETARTIEMDMEAAHAIEVTARDEFGAALVGVEIAVLARGEPLPIGAKTGERGVAKVSRLPAGPWRIQARAAGYEEVSGHAERDGEVVSVTLRKLGTLVVHVISSSDRDAKGARVAVAGATLWPARSSDTNARGEVRIGGLSAGTYALRATLGDDVSATELGVALARGEEKEVSLQLAPGRAVTVRVTDGSSEDADSVPGARVILTEGGLSPFPLEATTDGKGRARLGPIAPGAATLGVRADGFVPRGAVPLVDPSPPETRIALVRSGVLSGRVVDARGRPVGGATIEVVGTDPSGGPIFDDPRRSLFQTAHFDVMLAGPAPLIGAGELGVVPGPVPLIPRLFNRNAMGFSSGVGAGATLAPADRGPRADPWVTREDGTFRAAPASPGRIRAIVRHPQYVQAESDVVTLTASGQANVNVILHEGGVLEGRVYDAHDRPVAGARIFVSDTRGSLERTSRSARDGTFAFAALPASVSLTASAEADGTSEVRMTVAIPEGGKNEITVRLPEPRDPIAVHVVDARGRPVGSVQLSASSLSADSPLRTTAFTDARGDAHLNGTRGLPLRIEARAPSFAPRVVTIDGNVDNLPIELAPAEAATGVVQAARGGKPVAGADVTLYTDLGARHARSDAHGVFALSELAPGGARLQVRAAGFAPVTRGVTIPESDGRGAVVLAPVRLSAGATIEGDVVDALGNPVSGARVATDHVPTWLLVGSNPDGVAVTDAKGRFALHDVPEGTITVEAFAPDLGRARAAGIEVRSDRTSDPVHVVIAAAEENAGLTREPQGSGSVAITLGETDAPPEVLVVSVVEASEAERAGVMPGDVLLAVDETPVTTIEKARMKLSGPIAVDVLLRVRRGDRSRVVRVVREAVRR